MRNVIYRGVVYAIPNNHRFIAMDSDGEVYSYKTYITIQDDEWIEWDRNGESVPYHIVQLYNNGWETSMEEV